MGESQNLYGNGWVKIHRKLFNKAFYKNSQYLHLWIHLIMKANHKPTEILWNNETIKINEGQLLTGRKVLSGETGIPESTIEKILKHFEMEQQIKQQKTTKFRIITINQWENYQVEQQSNNSVTTEEQQRDTNKNEKNNKNDKNKEIMLVGDRELVIKDYFIDLLPIDANQNFIITWCEWVDYRKEKKQKLTKTTVIKQLNFLLKQSDPIRCINQSIQNGWQGLFEEKSNNGRATNQQRRKDYVTKDEYKSELESLYKGGS